MAGCKRPRRLTLTALFITLPALLLTGAGAAAPDETVAEDLERAWHLVAARRWSDAAFAIDALLAGPRARVLVDLDEDTRCQLRTRIEDLLAEAPAPLIDALRSLRRGDARRLCADPSDQAALARAADCFPYTRAGAEARIILAHLAAEAGDLAAAHRHRRALEHPLSAATPNERRALADALRRLELRRPPREDGVMIWRLPYLNRLEDGAAPVPKIFGGEAFVYDGSRLMAVSMESGLLRWSVAMPARDPEAGAERRLAVAGGRVVHVDRGLITAYDRRDGQVTWSLDPQELGGPEKPLIRARVDALSLGRGRVFLMLTEQVLGEGALTQGGVVFPVRASVHTLDAATGRAVGRVTLGEAWLSWGCTPQPALRLRSASLMALSDLGHIAALETADGRLRWLRLVEPRARNVAAEPPVIERSGGAIQIRLHRGEVRSMLLLDERSGALREARDCPEDESEPGGPVRCASPQVILVSTRDGLTAYGRAEPAPLRPPRSVAGCIAALADPSYRRRAAAFARLRALGPAADRALRQASASPDPTRAWAIATLLRERRIAERLRAWRAMTGPAFARYQDMLLRLMSPRISERLTAFRYLSDRYSDPRLRLIRRSLLGDPSPEVRRAVAERLVKDGDWAALDELSRHLDLQGSCFAEQGPKRTLFSLVSEHAEALADPRQVASLRRFLAWLGRSARFEDLRDACETAACFGPSLGYQHPREVIDELGGHERLRRCFSEESEASARRKALIARRRLFAKVQSCWAKGQAEGE